jgi:competence/damage-inducible protein CinA-like protein
MISTTPAQGEARGRRILVAELLAVGSELTVGETTDTNSGELARSLVAHGVGVARIANLPDDLEVVVDALRTALARVDLVVTTGGLGPTPDDLTREAVAAVCGEQVSVDPETLAWLEELWARRGHPFPSVNVKQAWVIPSARSLPNAHGTAPGWWVERPDGRVIVTLPGPPREMRPMWADQVLPRLAALGVGADLEVRTLRLHGIGESQVAELLGETLLRAPNPIVATYARHEAVDVRISARPSGDRSAGALADEAEAVVVGALGDYVWARGGTSWADALGEELDARGWTLAISERGTAGALVALLRGLPAVRRASVVNDDVVAGPRGSRADEPDIAAEAQRVRLAAGTDVGFAIHAIDRGRDTRVLIGVATPGQTRADDRLAFQRGAQGADRAAIAGTAVLLAALREARTA